MQLLLVKSDAAGTLFKAYGLFLFLEIWITAVKLFYFYVQILFFGGFVLLNVAVDWQEIVLLRRRNKVCWRSGVAA